MVPPVEARIRDRKLDAPLAIGIAIGAKSTVVSQWWNLRTVVDTQLARARLIDRGGRTDARVSWVYFWGELSVVRDVSLDLVFQRRALRPCRRSEMLRLVRVAG